MEIFFACSFFIMIMMASTPKPVQAMLLGQAVVCLTTSLLVFKRGGWDILWGILALLISILCVLITGIISFPMSKTTWVGFDQYGNRQEASRFVVGEGASTETLKLPSPTYILQVPYQDYKLISPSLDKEN
jgi:hypothetical protein